MPPEIRWFPLMPDTLCLFRCSPARKLPTNAGTLDSWKMGMSLTQVTPTDCALGVPGWTIP